MNFPVLTSADPHEARPAQPAPARDPTFPNPAPADDLRSTKPRDGVLSRSAKLGICRVDAQGIVKSWNSAAEKILGWRATEITARRFPIAGVRERDLFEACIKVAFAGKSTGCIEARCWSSTGKPIEVTVSISPLMGLEETVSQALIVFENLTDVRRAGRRLRLFNTITSTLTAASSVERAIESVLASIACEFGWDYAEFWQWDKANLVLSRASRWHSLAPHAVLFAAESQSHDRSVEARLLAEVLQSGTPRFFPGCGHDRRFPRGDLAARCGLADAIAVPIGAGRDPAGVLLFFAALIEGLDEEFLAVMASTSAQIAHFLAQSQGGESLRQAEENLQPAKKSDGSDRLAEDVIHDFNKVVTIILGCGEIARDKMQVDKSSGDRPDEDANAGKQAAAGLTRQFLTLCRKAGAEPVILNLNVTVTEMENMLRRLIGEDSDLATRLSPDLGCLCAVFIPVTGCA